MTKARAREREIFLAAQLAAMELKVKLSQLSMAFDTPELTDLRMTVDRELLKIDRWLEVNPESE